MSERFSYSHKSCSILDDGKFWLDASKSTYSNKDKIIGFLNYLSESRDGWRDLIYECDFYCACYKKAIEKLYEKYDGHDERAIQLLDELTSLYGELENEYEEE